MSERTVHNAAEEIISPSLLLNAYASGIFPMAETAEDPTVHWIDPQRRGILPLDGFHVPRRFARYLRHHPYTLKIDTAFEEVVRLCAEPVPERPQTWINKIIFQSYCTLHTLGFAHSVECWQRGKLVGGLYGVALGAAFFGESMASRSTNASKVALTHLVELLRYNGFLLLDTQFLTEHLARFGAIEISRNDYHRLLLTATTRQNVTFRERTDQTTDISG